jgi:glutathione S-transferase
MTTIQDRLKPSSIIKNHYDGHYQRHTPRFIVGYWSIRGLAAPLRMMLSAAQIDHWVVLYDVQETQEGWDRSSWFQEKEWLREPYPLINLPFLVDCAHDRVVSQTNAILAYLGRELKMLGTTPVETCQCEELLCEIMDLRNKMVKFAYAPASPGNDLEDAKELIEQANVHFHKLEQHLILQYPNILERVVDPDEVPSTDFYKKGVCHLVGGKFTAPDFHLWEMLDQFEELCQHYELPSCFGTATTNSKEEKTKTFPYLREFLENFIHLPENGTYYAQWHKEVKLPLNNPYARFGSDPKPTSGFGTYVRGQDAPWRNLGVIEKHYTKIESDIDYCDDEDGGEKIAQKKRKH